MEEKRKKIYITIGTVAALIAIGIGAYFYFFRKEGTTIQDVIGSLPFLGERRVLPPAPPPAPRPRPERETEAEREGRLVQIISKPVVSPALTKDGERILYYARAGGNLESVDLAGKNVQKLSNVTVLGIYESLWQPVTKGVGIVSYIESSIMKRFIGEVATTGVAFLPQGVTTAAWSPDGKEIAYIIQQGDTYNLTLADEGGQKPKVVYSTPIPDFNAFWPSANTILLVSRPSGIAPGILFSFDVKRNVFEKIFTEQYGLTILPSPDGISLLYAKTNASGLNLSLNLSDIDGRGPRSIGAPTLPEKCVFLYGKAGIICAVPTNLPEFSILPDGWYMGENFFRDRFVTINATTTAVSVLFSEREFDAFNLFMSLDNQFLFFQDKKDFTVWRLRMEP